MTASHGCWRQGKRLRRGGLLEPDGTVADGEMPKNRKRTHQQPRCPTALCGYCEARHTSPPRGLFEGSCLLGEGRFCASAGLRGSPATLISVELMGGWWAIRLDTGWGQLVNIFLTHIRPDHQHGDVAKMAQAHAGPGAHAARARGLPHPCPIPSPARISANAAETDSQNRTTG